MGAMRVRLKRFLPRELFPRSLMIVILPMVLIQLVIAYVFLERHWNVVTQRLSHNVVGTINLLVELRLARDGADAERLSRLASDAHEMSLAFLPGESLPAPTGRAFWDFLDLSLAQELEQQIGRPFWLNTRIYDSHVDIRIALPGEVMRILLQRNRVYATNAHIFLIWMTAGSLLLLAVAIVFLRNQIRPMEKLAAAAERFGLGQDDPHFKIAGATEIRKAGQALLQMRERLRSHIEQRTIILAGVSHDLRTPLTRLKLQLALLEDTGPVRALKADTQEMEEMLENYLNFAKTYQGESPQPVEIGALLREVSQTVQRQKPQTTIRLAARSELTMPLKRQAMKRCLFNLMDNACKHAKTVSVSSQQRSNHMMIVIEDDGPGIARAQRENVFRPFFRLAPSDARLGKGNGKDNGRDEKRPAPGGTGLGLAIARDVARGHGGDIRLDKSAALGGVRVRVMLPIALG